MRPYTAEQREVAFWNKVIKGPNCWIWSGARGSNGYGRFNDVAAHRFSWELANGSVPVGFFVLHHCDVKGCVRPDHLFLGDQGTNIRDMLAKGRQADRRGEKAGRAKLTEQQVLEIRRRRQEGRVEQLAKDFGVSKATIGAIITKRTWSHI